MDIFHVALIIIFLSAHIPVLTDRERIILAHHRHTYTSALAATMDSTTLKELMKALDNIDVMVELAEGFVQGK